MASKISPEEYKQILQQERKIAHECSQLFNEFGGTQTDITQMQQMIASLDDPFLLVVVGEFNAGKSTCINALLREELQSSGLTRTTEQITMIRHGETPYSFLREDGILQVYSPAKFLENFSIVDTPGVDSALDNPQQLNEEFLPRSDFILFVTIASHALDIHEHHFLELIRAWGRKVVIVLNKIDHPEVSGRLSEPIDFVREQCERILKFHPDIFPISARQALAASEASGPDEAIEMWENSGLSALRSYLLSTLHNSQRQQLKHLNHLEGMRHLLGHATDLVEHYLHGLEQAQRLVHDVSEHLCQYRKDLERDFSLCLSEIENVVLAMQTRGNRFLNDQISIRHIIKLFKTEAIRESFEREVIEDSATRIAQEEQKFKTQLIENQQTFQHDITSILGQIHTLPKIGENFAAQEQQFELAVKKELNKLNKLDSQRDDVLLTSVEKQLASERDEILHLVQTTTEDMSEVKDYLDIAMKHLKEIQTTTTGTTLTGVSGLGIGLVAAGLLGTLAIEVGALFSIGLLGLGMYSITNRRYPLRWPYPPHAAWHYVAVMPAPHHMLR